jgi:hypothetical protein
VYVTIERRLDAGTEMRAVRWEMERSERSEPGGTAVWEIAHGDGLTPCADPRADFAAVSLVYLAMRTGEPLRIQGTLSRRLVENLAELQQAWVKWCPRVYSRVPVEATEISDRAVKVPDTAVLAFSGGLDCTFALLHHQGGHAGPQSKRITCGMLVHGFDVPLKDRAAFAAVESGARGMLTRAAVPLAVVRTDWRARICRKWEWEFIAGLAGCLHLFEGIADAGMLSKGMDYTMMPFPWGYNHAIDNLWSGDFAIIPDGGGFGRVEKLALVCENPDMTKDLRVCWEGPFTGENCGTCEKCTRTYLDFVAVGRPDLFVARRRTKAKHILRIRPKNEVQRVELFDIVRSARRRGVRDARIAMLHAALIVAPVLGPVRSAARLLGRRVARIPRGVARRIARLRRRRR